VADSGSGRAAASRDILIVDDDADIRESVAAILQHHGYRVRTAANGRDALAELAHERPALILLDLMMPVMSGWEFVDRVKSYGLFSTDHIIVMSAGDSPLSCLRNLPKPFDVEEFIAVVQACGCPGSA
jgi:two-component system response regulator CpxR